MVFLILFSLPIRYPMHNSGALGERRQPEDSEEKLCAMTCLPDGVPWQKLLRFTKDPRYVCSECKRAATNPENLCFPIAL
jgi:hypothetical protein